jgi:hypothetical protein
MPRTIPNATIAALNAKLRCKENALFAREGRLHEQEKQLKADQEAVAAMRTDLEERAELRAPRSKDRSVQYCSHRAVGPVCGLAPA